MLTYMLDTNICIYVIKNYPLDLREKFNALAEQPCISSITLGELHYGAEKSARRAGNLTAIEHFVARLDVLPFGGKAAAGQRLALVTEPGEGVGLSGCSQWHCAPPRGSAMAHRGCFGCRPNGGIQHREPAGSYDC